MNLRERLCSHIDEIRALLKAEYYHNQELFNELTYISDEIRYLEEAFRDAKDWDYAALVQDIWSSLQRIKMRLKGTQEKIDLEKRFLEETIMSLKNHENKLNNQQNYEEEYLYETV